MNFPSNWTPDQLRVVLLDQFNAFWERDTGVERDQLAEVEKAAALPHAVIISGLRRVGKSTLMAQFAHRLGKDAFYYVNFEEDRLLGFRAADADDLYRMLVEVFGERKIFILDEIQNVPGWERFVRRFMDQGYKFYITGSNAALLSRELGTRLTGRYVPIELFPFSFPEFLNFRGESVPDLHRMTSAERARLSAGLLAYLEAGGVPDALKYPDLPLLRSLYDDVLYRDIAARYRLEAVSALRELAFYLFSNPANLVSYNKLKAQLNLGSVNTVSSYIEYLENSWLIFTLNVFAVSVKRQQVAPKKVYTIDTGMVNSVGFRFSPNTGRLLENAVFLALRRRTRDIYYYRTQDGLEVDFYLPGEGRLVQVAQSLDQPETRARELRAIEVALGEVRVESALVLAEAGNEDLEIGGVMVRIRSVSEWMAKGRDYVRR
jgi:predicted AAA+ superfamily ATPase